MERRKTGLSFFIGVGVFGFLFPWLFFVLFKFFERIFIFTVFPRRPYNYIGASILIFIGGFWMIWATVYLVYRGCGSPIEAFGKAVEPTKKLVTAGPFKYTRNPMMFGFFIILLGEAVFFQTVAGLLLVPLIALGFIIYWKFCEEKFLFERFGHEYDEYRRKTQVLIPIPSQMKSKLTEQSERKYVD